MHSIAASSSTRTQPLPTPPSSTTSTEATTDAASAGQGGGDLLAAMNPAMDAAFAVGRPTDAGGAAAILATTGAYVAGAHATIDKLDEGIRRREREVEQLRLSDPDAAAKKEGELELLRKLRDRIELSIERVTRTAAGGDSDEVGGDQETIDLERTLEDRARRRSEEEELLEQRRQLLAPTTIAASSTTDSSTVAGTYAATAARSA